MSEHLRVAAQRRHNEAERRAMEALREMNKDGSPVNFVAVARRARVSTDFLYRQPGLRKRIEIMRAASKQRQRLMSLTKPTDEDETSSSAVLALSCRIKELQKRHREEISHLQRALAAAHGESLELRRKLAAYELDRSSKINRGHTESGRS